MFASLFFLLVGLHGGEPPIDFVSLVNDVRDVALMEPPLFKNEDEDLARLKTANVLAVWAWCESRGKASVVGDNGRSFGVVQIGRHWLSRDARDQILTNRKLGLKLGLALMRSMVAHCGSVKGGLQEFSSGRCNGARGLVKERCSWAGGC